MSSFRAIDPRAPTRLGLALIAAMAGFAGRAEAEPSRANHDEAAVAFEEAARFFRSGRIDDACSAFARSLRLEPKNGTLLNLALCHERLGRVATAWLEFTEARTQAMAERRPERARFAEQRLEALASRVTRVRIDVEAAPFGLQLTLDDQPISPDLAMNAVPMDPGPHILHAVAPGRRVVDAQIVVPAEGTTLEVRIPSLTALSEHVRTSAEELTPAPSSGSATPAPSAPRNVSVAGLAIAGMGVVVIGAGSYFGVRALQARQTAESLCRTGHCSEGHSALDQGVREAWLADGAFALGAAALATGAYLIFRHPENRLSAMRGWAPTASSRGLGASYRLEW